MSDNPSKPSAESDAKLERQIRAERKFTLEEAIGRMAGPGSMKGASPVTRKPSSDRCSATDAAVREALLVM